MRIAAASRFHRSLGLNRLQYRFHSLAFPKYPTIRDKGRMRMFSYLCPAVVLGCFSWSRVSNALNDRVSYSLDRLY